MLTPDTLEIDRDYHQRERWAEADAHRRAARIWQGGRSDKASIARRLRAAWPGWANPRARATALRHNLVGRILARIACRLRHSPGSLVVLFLLVASALGFRHVQTAPTEDCADAVPVA